MIKYFITIAAAGFLGAALSMPAMAQSQFELGYKDRIFEENYVLPDKMTKADLDELATRIAMLGVINQAFLNAPANPKVKQLLRGECVGMFVRRLETPSSPTQPQRVLEAFPEAFQKADARSEMDVPCAVQVLVFYAAFIDPQSQQRQIQRLTTHIRERYAGDWLTDADTADPIIQAGAKRLVTLISRANRLADEGMQLSELINNALFEESAAERIRRLSSHPDTYNALVRELAALEEQARRDLPKLRADSEARALEEEKRAHRAQLITQADMAIADAKASLEQLRQKIQSAQIRAELDPNPDSRDARIAADYRKQRDGLEGHLNEVLNNRERLLAHLARLDGRLPQETAGVVKGKDLSAEAPLAAAPEATPVSAAVPSSACEMGRACRVVERTIFCRTLDDVRTVLARPIGADRRGILAALKARGACTLIEGGVDVVPKGKIHQVTPIGEAPVGVVQATAGTGQSGFLLASALSASPLAAR